MANEHDQEWGSTFAGWMQQVVDEMAQEGGSNAFSNFVHRETLRCLSDQLALRLPGVGRGAQGARSRGLIQLIN